MLRVALFLALTVQCAFAGCNQGWVPYREFCVTFGEDTLTWYDAAAICNVYGGRLVQIEGEAKHDWIVDELKKRNIFDAWVAGSKLYSGVWEWIPTYKQIKAYLNWGPGEPNNLNTEKCLQIKGALGFTWNDERCLTELKYVCEKRAAVS